MPGGTPAGLHRLARNLAGHLGWIAVGQGWPPTPQPGAILAVPPMENHRTWGDVLARARWLVDGARPDWLDAVPANPAVSRDGAHPTPDLVGRTADTNHQTPLAPPVVIVTSAGRAAIHRNPKRALERLAAFACRHPCAEAVEIHSTPHLPTPVPLAELIAAVEELDAAVSPAMTDRKDPRAGQAGSMGAQPLGDPDRSIASPAEMEDPTKDAGADATTKTTLSDGDQGSTHEGGASPEESHTVHPTFPAPTSDQWISQDADQQDELDPSREEHLTNTRNEPQDAEALCALDDQPSPF